MKFLNFVTITRIGYERTLLKHIIYEVCELVQSIKRIEHTGRNNMRNRDGRRSKLNGEIKDALIAGVSRGLTLKAACKCAGISYSTLASWRQKCRKESKNEEPSELAQLIACIDLEVSYQQREHRLAAMSCLKPRDYRHGWKNP